MPKTKLPKIDKEDAGGWRREALKQRKSVVALTTSITNFIARMDLLMKQPSTVERGRAVAKLMNELDMANDHARYFALGVEWRKDKKS